MYRDDDFMGEQAQQRILVVDNDARVRAALQTLLAQEPGFLAIRESYDLETLAVQFKAFEPHLVLLDWELPGRPAAALLFTLNGCTIRPRVIVLSKRPESEREALAAGADAFISKGDPPEILLSAFRNLVGISDVDIAEDLHQ
jgi:DNA-binding NarL/FixJ family response regulator